MDKGGCGVAATSLWGRAKRVRRLRWWGAMLLVALPSVPLIAQHHDRSGPVASDQDKFWHDASLPFLLLAVTLMLWRAPEKGLPVGLRLRDLHRRVCRRTSVVLVLGASLALAWYNWSNWHGDPGAARTAAHLGVALLYLGLLPTLLDPVLWLLWPAPVRREARSARAAEALYRPKPARFPRSRRLTVPQALGSITDFDPDLGASGRPRPTLHKAAGPRSSGRCTAPARARERHKGTHLHWNGTTLVVGDGSGAVRQIRLADDAHPDGVAELVRLGPRGQVLFLDRDGYRVDRTLTGLTAQPGTLGQLAQAAGLTFNAYELSPYGDVRAEQVGLLFPRRPRRARRRR